MCPRKTVFHFMLGPGIRGIDFLRDPCNADPNDPQEVQKISLNFRFFMLYTTYDQFYHQSYIQCPSIHPSNGAITQIGPWPRLLRLRNNNILWCEVVSLTTNPP
jgi:hypothetical protein